MNPEDGTPKHSQMPQHMLNQADTWKSFKRNFVLYVVSCFFNGSKDICAPYFTKNVMNVEDITTINWCQYTIHRLCESAKKGASNFDRPNLFLMVSSLFFISVIY